MRALRFIWNELKIPILLFFTTVIAASVGYKALFPEHSWLKTIYATAITLTTVGYGDILGVNDVPSAQVYTIIITFLGMGIVLYSASSITAFIIEGKLGELFKMEKTAKKIANMKNHYVICGVGETGHHVIEEVTKSRRKLVIIDSSAEKCEALQIEFPDAAVICGDANHDEFLERANIQNAKALIATLGADKDNLVLVFTAKMINPKITLVSKSDSVQMIRKLKSAGADYVVSPQFIGGLRMASVAMRPSVVSFLDRMLKGSKTSVRVGEFVIPENSVLVGKTFREAPIKEQTGINVFAYSKFAESEDFQYNPSPDTTIEAGGVMLFICSPEEQEAMEKEFS